MEHTVVQRWLSNVVRPYAEPQRVYVDVDQTLIALSSLSPKTEVYTYDDGRTDLLLSLNGTLPVRYHESSYNIPVTVWIPKAYPQEPPIAYVVPTQHMLIRRGRCVSLEGVIMDEYLQRWRSKWESCTLLELLRNLQDLFGREPPVYAKPAQPSRQHGIASPQIGSPDSSFPAPWGSSRPNGPHSAPAAQLPSPASRLIRSHAGDKATADAGAPANRVSRATGERSAVGGEKGQPSHGYAEHVSAGHAEHISARHAEHVSAGHAEHVSARHAELRSARHAEHSSAIGFAADLQADTSADLAVLPLPPPLPPLPTLQSSIHHSSGSAVSPDAANTANDIAPPPPPPPNPEMLALHEALHKKMRSRAQTLSSTLDDENYQLRLLVADLVKGEPAILDEMARLEAVREVCRSSAAALDESIAQARNRVDELQRREDADLDNLVVTTSIVGNQVIQLQAEDSAISDALYHLGRALSSERLRLDRFLKQTRFLAREQFFKRALAGKIRGSMGWAEDSATQHTLEQPPRQGAATTSQIS